MNIHIKFYGVFRSAAKTSEIDLDIQEKNPTVKLVISQLVSRKEFHELKTLLLSSETSDPRPNALIMVSGREVNALKELDTELQESDELTLLPIAHGG